MKTEMLGNILKTSSETRKDTARKDQFFILITILISSLSVADFASGYNIQLDDDDVIDTVAGHLNIISAQDGAVRRLNKRDIQAASNSGSQTVRLDLGPQYPSIEFALTPQNVWTADSRVYQRVGAGRETVESQVHVDSDCFMGGLLLSHEGVASFSHCNGLRGFIQTPEREYIIEQAYHTDPVALIDWEFPEVIVTLMRPTPNSFEENNFDVYDTVKKREEEELDNEEQNEDAERESEEDDEDVTELNEEEDVFFNQTEFTNDTIEDQISRGKRAVTRPIAAEVAVYVDRNFADYLKRRGIDTLQKVTDFLITKWNAVARIYGNVKKVGVPFDIQLKRVEVWWKNPPYYKPIQQDQNMGKHLSVFCSNTKADIADHRMLYTIGVGGQVAGIAYVGRVCRSAHSCSVARSRKRSTVFVELHEFGHNLGFLHDPKMNCPKPYGFMGWRQSTFQDCYREELLKRIDRSSMRCLRQRNMRNDRINRRARQMELWASQIPS